MRRAIIITLVLMQVAWGQEKLQVDLYALPSRIHSKLDLSLFADSESFLATLKKIEGSSAVKTPVSFRQEIGWGRKSNASKQEPVIFFTSFDTDSDSKRLVGEAEDTFMVGYQAEWEAVKEGAELANLAFSFTWIPLYKKDRISGGGSDAWMPTYPSLNTQTSFQVKNGQATLAALWASAIETEFNPKEETWLYLLVVRRP